MQIEGKGSKEREMAGGGEICYGIDLYVLPEGCIAAVISFTSPRDACRLAAVSKIFKSAADSDSVWEAFLPSDYQQILARSYDQDEVGRLLDFINTPSKKELYFHLVNRPLLIDGGLKSFSLEPSTGKKRYTIGARDLAITWGDTPRYWRWRSVPESRFSEIAELVTVCWLEVRGKIKTSMLSPETNYAAYFVFKMAEEAYGLYTPAEAMIKTVGGKAETQNVYLDPQEAENQRYQIVPRRIGVFNRIRTTLTTMQPTLQGEGDKQKLPKRRDDGWLEVEIGEFFTRRDEDGEMEMSVSEVKAGNWKGGLLVEGIEIRPKMVKK